jgi:hypothetical protein
MIILPPRLIKVVYGLPESTLDIHTTQSETIQTKWTVWDREVADNDFQINVVRNQITRNLEHLTPLMADELSRGFDRWWGAEADGEWKEVKVWDACLKLIAGASNGAFCGAPLCKSIAPPDRVLETNAYSRSGRNLLEQPQRPRDEHLRRCYAHQRVAQTTETHHWISGRVDLLVLATKGDEGMLAFCERKA